MNNKKQSFGRYNWIREGRTWQKRFEETSFNWIPRTNNQPADLLAKHSLPSQDDFYFHYYVPSYITKALHCNH
ncbi:putative ribonuclease H domain-containing protein [Arabidopsis thaliana]